MAGEKRLRPGAKPRNKNKKQTTPELEANEEEKEVGEEKTEDTASTDTPAEQPQVKGGGAIRHFVTPNFVQAAFGPNN